MHIVSTEETVEVNEYNSATGMVRAMLFTVIMVGQAAQSVLFTVLTPVLPAMAHSFGGNATSFVQLLYALPSLGLMIVGLFSGWLLDRAGLKTMLLASMILYGLMGSVPLFTADIPVLLVTRLILGAACATLSTSCTLLLVMTYSGAKRSRAMGYQSSIGSVAGLLTLVAAGAIAKPLGWHAAFIIYAAIAVVIVGCIFGSVKTPTALAKAEKRAAVKAEAAGGAWTVIKMIWPVYLVGCLLFTYPMASGSALPFVLQERGMTPGTEQSLILSAFTIFSAIGSFLFGRAQQRIGARATFGTGLLLSGIGMVLAGTFRNEAVTFAGMGLSGLGLGFYIPHLWMVATSVPPSYLRGRAAGMFNSAMYLGGFTSPFIIGALSRLFGSAGVFTAIGVAALAGTALLVVTKKGMLNGTPRLALSPAAEGG